MALKDKRESVKFNVFLSILAIFISGGIFVFQAPALAQEISNELLPALVDLQTMVNGGDTSATLKELGVHVPVTTNTVTTAINPGFSLPAIFAYLIFGAIGLGAFIFGQKERNWKSMMIGIILMGYPYFVSNPLWLWGIGLGLTVLIFIWRD